MQRNETNMHVHTNMNDKNRIVSNNLQLQKKKKNNRVTSNQLARVERVSSRKQIRNIPLEKKKKEYPS